MGGARKLILGLAGFLVLAPAVAFVALQIWLASSVNPVEPFQPTEAETEQLAFYEQPESWFLDNLSGPRETIDGQTLDPKFQYMMEEARAESEGPPGLAALMFATPWGRGYIRNQVDRSWRLYSKVTAPMADVEDRIIEGRDGPVPVRIYRPDVPDADGPLPILVYHHGGGWIFSSIAAMDRVTRLFANEARAIVISVDYRLAPEHPYPAASDDGEDVFLWALENAASLGGDPARIGVGGDSAGGHVAINIAQRRLAAGEPGPAAMLLIYPGAGFPQDDDAYQLFGEGYTLNADFIEFILPRVFPEYSTDDASRVDAFMNPANAESLVGMPPAIIATAGFDLLRDRGRAFAEQLRADGVQVSYTNYPTLTHSYLQFSGVIEDAERASTESARAFGDLIRSAGS